MRDFKTLQLSSGKGSHEGGLSQKTEFSLPVIYTDVDETMENEIVEADEHGSLATLDATQPYSGCIRFAQLLRRDWSSGYGGSTRRNSR